MRLSTVGKVDSNYVYFEHGRLERRKTALFKPKLSLAEPAQSSKAIGLITESENDDAVGKGNDTGC